MIPEIRLIVIPAVATPRAAGELKIAPTIRAYTPTLAPTKHMMCAAVRLFFVNMLPTNIRYVVK